ncbi:MAG: hypothetical protein ABSB70_00880 [Candidatus Velthaea sp.]
MSIGDTGASADSGGAIASLAAANSASTMLTQVANAQVANVEALFGSLGLGTNVNAVA